MLRKFLPFTICMLLLALPACSRSPGDARQPSASLEQAAPDGLSPEKLVAPAHERRLRLDELGVARWHQQGWRGQGVKAAILDSGFRDYRHFLGKGLPARVKVRSFRKDGNLEARDSQHGILCGEVLHALAPDAELLLANWEPDSPQAFLQAVQWAKSQGARVISCSLIMPSWSDGEGGGDVHRGLQSLMGNGSAAHDLLCFASAGNTAQRHWCGFSAPDDDGWHRWHGSAIDNTLKPWGAVETGGKPMPAERIAVELYGPLQTAHEIHVYLQPSGELIGKSLLRVDATRTCGRAVVRFEPKKDATYSVRVRCLEQRAGQRQGFHLVVLGGSLGYITRQGSIPFPGDGGSVMAVGAVDEQKHRLAYSSCGPNSRLPKPDFVATVPFPSLCRERPFAGTSAAAPQAAALAALVWSRHPDWTSSQVNQALREAALDLGPPGHDWETGHGLLRLPSP